MYSGTPRALAGDGADVRDLRVVARGSPAARATSCGKVSAERGSRRRAVSVSWSVPGRPAEAQVDPAGVERRQRAELLGDHQRRMVGQHDPAGAQPDPLGVRRHVGDEHGGRRRGDRRDVVVLGVPDAQVAELLGAPRQPHGGPEGLDGRLALADGGEVEDRERDAGVRRPKVATRPPATPRATPGRRRPARRRSPRTRAAGVRSGSTSWPVRRMPMPGAGSGEQAAAGADDGRRDHEPERVDEPRVEQRGRQAGAAVHLELVARPRLQDDLGGHRDRGRGRGPPAAVDRVGEDEPLAARRPRGRRRPCAGRTPRRPRSSGSRRRRRGGPPAARRGRPGAGTHQRASRRGRSRRPAAMTRSRLRSRSGFTRPPVGDEALEAVGAALPDRALLGEPVVHERQPLAGEGAGAHPAALARADQALGLERPDVLHERREGHGDVARELADAGRSRRRGGGSRRAAWDRRARRRRRRPSPNT